MRFKNKIAFVLALSLTLGLCACGADESDKKAGDKNSNIETTTQTESKAPVDNTDIATQPQETKPVATEPAKDPSYIVNVVDEGGNAVVGAMIMICQGENCTIATTDANGDANFFDKEEAEYEVKFAALPSGYDYTTEEQVFHFAQGTNELTIVLKTVA